MERQRDTVANIDMQIESESWNSRLAAYDVWIMEAEKSQINDDILQQRLCKLPNLINRESNISVLKRAYDFLIVTVGKFAIPACVAEAISKSVVSKIGLKPLHEKVEFVMQRFVEAGRSDIAMEALFGGSQNKAPHVSSACFEVISNLIKTFPNRKFDNEKLLNIALSGLENRNLPVRQTAKILLVELGRRSGPALLSQLQGVKPIVMNEILAEIAGTANETPSRQRTHASREAVASALPEPLRAQPAEVQPVKEAVDIIKLLPPSFYDDLKSNNWSIRVNAGERFLELLNANPTLDPKACYGSVLSELANVISRENSPAVIGAVAKCIVALARNLKKKLPLLPRILLPAVCLRMKDRKPQIINSLTEALDAIMESTSLEASYSFIAEALESKYVGVKVQTALMLSRYFVHAGSVVFACPKSVKVILDDLVKLTSDSDPAVRDGALTAIGAARAVATYSESGLFAEIITPIKDDRSKMDKIMTHADGCRREMEKKNEPKEELAPLTRESGYPGGHDDHIKPSQSGLPCSTPPDKTLQEMTVYGSPSPNEEQNSTFTISKAAACDSSEVPAKRNPAETTAANKEPFLSLSNWAEPQSLLCSLNDSRHQTSLCILSQWSSEKPTDVVVSELRNRMTVVCKLPLFSLLWSDDLNERRTGIDCILQSHEMAKDTFLLCRGLFLKWSCVQLYTNYLPLQLHALDLIKNILGTYVDDNGDDTSSLSDSDAECLLPHILLLFENADHTLRVRVRELVRFMANVCPYDILLVLLSEAMLESSNELFTSECINVMRVLLCISPLDHVVPKVLDFLAPYLNHKSAVVRNVSLNAFIAVYAQNVYDREDLRQYIGAVPDILDKLDEYCKMNRIETFRFHDLDNDWPFKDTYPRM